MNPPSNTPSAYDFILGSISGTWRATRPGAQERGVDAAGVVGREGEGEGAVVGGGGGGGGGDAVDGVGEGGEEGAGGRG